MSCLVVNMSDPFSLSSNLYSHPQIQVGLPQNSMQSQQQQQQQLSQQMPIQQPTSSNTMNSNAALFEEFENYRFSDDADFKAGLPTVMKAIKGTGKSAAEIDEMIARAQWFYFTRLKNISTPWEAYASASKPSGSINSSASASTPSSHSRSPSLTNQPSPRDSLAVLNNLAEAKKMMSEVRITTTPPAGSSPPLAPEGKTQWGTNGGPMAFSSICRLISEGRADEFAGVKEISEELNASPASEPSMSYKLKPWELPPRPNSHPQQQQQQQTTTSRHTSPQPLSTSPPIFGNPSPHSHSTHSPSPLQNGQIYFDQFERDPNQKQPSPPGTSSSFTNPPLAPSMDLDTFLTSADPNPLLPFNGTTSNDVVGLDVGLNGFMHSFNPIGDEPIQQIPFSTLNPFNFASSTDISFLDTPKDELQQPHFP